METTYASLEGGHQNVDLIPDLLFLENKGVLLSDKELFGGLHNTGGTI